jgi:crotonobetainyl-CoA:carnitine CoA-transferase CaiB-like acyl-CoA transferase
MAGPLDGITVVELGVWVAGPAAGGILADWGADVVKIEPPAGEFRWARGADLDLPPPLAAWAAVQPPPEEAASVAAGSRQ